MSIHISPLHHEQGQEEGNATIATAPDAKPVNRLAHHQPAGWRQRLLAPLALASVLAGTLIAATPASASVPNLHPVFGLSTRTASESYTEAFAQCPIGTTVIG